MNKPLYIFLAALFAFFFTANFAHAAFSYINRSISSPGSNLYEYPTSVYIYEAEAADSNDTISGQYNYNLANGAAECNSIANSTGVIPSNVPTYCTIGDFPIDAGGTIYSQTGAGTLIEFYTTAPTTNASLSAGGGPMCQNDSASFCFTYKSAAASPAPTASLSASPTSIIQGNSSGLTSACTNSTSASITNVGSVSATSATTSVSPSGTTTYTLTCTGAGGTATASATVTVSPPPAPAAALSANSPNIIAGGSTTFNYACTNSTSASISPTIGALSPVSGGTTGAVSPSTSTTYTLTCSGAGGTATASAVVSVTQLPDLTAALVAGQTSLTGTVGVPVSLNAIISNIGAGATGAPFQTTFWTNTVTNISGPNNSGATPYEFTSGYPGGFPANYGEVDGVTATFNSAGTYYYRVCANQDQNKANSVTESNTANNCSAWGTITITALPDLTATFVSGQQNLTGIVGVPVSLNATISNIGAGATGVPFTTTFWTNTTTNKYGATTYAFPSGVPSGFPANYGEVDGVTATFNSAGTYYYRVCANEDQNSSYGVTETNYSNNCTSVWGTITITALPDLTATVGPAINGAPGNTQTFTGTVTNSGAGPAPANFWNLLQVCDSGVLISGNCSSYDTITNGDYYTSAIAVGGSGSLSYSGAIPATAGAYAYRWCANYQTPFVVSSDAETNYGNNCSGWATMTVTVPLPDLSATVGPAISGTPGSTQTFTGTVTNSGAGPAPANFWNLLQVCDSGVLISGNCSSYDTITNGDYYTSAIAVGGSGSLSYSGAIPATAGAYAYRWCANYQTPFVVSSDAETNYGNNCSSWTTLTASYPATGGSCTYSPSSAGLNQGITWTAYPSGGNGSYGYSWSGTNLSGSGQTTTSSYGSAGTYPGSVTISSAGTQASPICTASGGGGGGPTIVAPPTCSVSNTNPQVNQAITYSASPSTSNPYTWTPTNSSMCTASNSSSETCTFTNASQFGMSVTDRYGQTGNCSTVTSGCIDGTPTLTATPNLVSGTGSGTGSSAVLSAGNMVANTSCVLTNATAGTTLHTYTEVNNACTVMSGQVTVSPTVQTKYCVSCDSGTPVCQVVNVAPTYQNF